MPFTRGVVAGLPAPLSPALKKRLKSYGFDGYQRFRELAADPVRRDGVYESITADSRFDIKNLNKGIREEPLVVGGGLHAAIFAAAYWREVEKKPIVVEKSDRLGGVFSTSMQPAFYLNSRNRPEGEGGPGTMGALNSIGGGVELSDVSGLEYPPQNDFAWVIALTLGLYGKNYTRTQLLRLGKTSSSAYIADFGTFYGNKSLRARDVVFATGIGDPEFVSRVARPSVISFQDFLERVDRFNRPLQNVKRAAVIGAGDSGSCVVEYLLGQGPQQRDSVASVDFPEVIDWYGQKCRFKEEYEEGARSRYAGIGRYMPRELQIDYYARVFPKSKALQTIQARGTAPKIRYRDNIGRAQVSSPYDLVVVCSGYEDDLDTRLCKKFVPRVGPVTEPVIVDGVTVAVRYPGTRIYKIGPCAGLRVTDMEKEDAPILAKVPQNSVAAFRYNKRTRAFAEWLAKGGDGAAEEG